MSEFSYLKYDVYFYLLSHSQICYYEKNEGNDIPTNLERFQEATQSVSQVLQRLVLLVGAAVESLAGQDHLVTELQPGGVNIKG